MTTGRRGVGKLRRGRGKRCPTTMLDGEDAPEEGGVVGSQFRNEIFMKRLNAASLA